jgi:hypothetical protein
MDNRRQYKYLQDFQVETINVTDGDTIILHLSDKLDIDDINIIQKEMQKCFPNNQVICANRCILDKITIVKQEQNPFVNINLEDLL